MWRLSMRWLVVVLTVSLGILLAALPAAAETPLGAGPDNPMTPSADWTALPVGATQYYGFHEEGDGELVDVKMEVVPHNGATFEIWSKDEVANWTDEVKFDPIGRGTTSCGCKPEDEVGKFNWEGSFTTAENYFVIVKHQGTVPSNFKLTISGKEVSFPFSPCAGAAEVVTPAAVVAAAATAPEAGTTPATAMAPTGEWTAIAGNGVHWYKFTYYADRGTEHDEDPPMVTVTLLAEKPKDNVRFDVWSQEEVDQLIAEGVDMLGVHEEEGTPVGCGSVTGAERGDYIWSGSFLKSGTYYVRVEHTRCRCQPGYYMLQIDGESVTY